MNKDTLNILADAISDVGSWQWWYIKDDMIQLEFCDVQLYDESRSEKDTHTTDVLAVRFYGHTFVLFLDNLADDGWYIRFQDDDSIIYPVDGYDLTFDEIKKAEQLLDEYRHKTFIKDYNGSETLSKARHLICSRCGDVGFIVGGDEIEIAGKKGKYTEEEIKTAAKKWWEYWKTYWKLRKTKEAYPKDYTCEITIPVSEK
ncbi:MAG: hypothetical protein IJI44_05070 [Erysipelotrichaceae bacterium]|nr:hypothetical protein [Erysipelotrichaceae bacterium]